MQVKQRIFLLFLCFVLVFSFLIPFAYALPNIDVNVDINPVEFFDWILDMGTGDIPSYWVGMFSDTYCPQNSEQGGVRRRHNFVKQHTTVDGKTGLFYVCEYCGESAGEVGQEAYQQQVSALPATGYNSAGRLIWQPTIADVRQAFVGNTMFYSSSTGTCNNGFQSMLSGNGFYRVRNLSGSFLEENAFFDFKVPFSGSYFLTGSLASEYLVQDIDGMFVSGSVYYLEHDVYTSGSDLKLDRVNYHDVYVRPGFKCNYSDIKWYFPVFEVIPNDTISGDTYNITTRPTSITGGNYGIVGDDGTINTVTNNSKIVNETTNNYYNPATGETKPILDWSYNYEDRTYDLTLDTGDKVSVEYGDQNVTITENTVVEGNTIVNSYTIYYMIEGSTPACDHDWQAGESTAPTCISPGKTPNTCTKCGATSVDITPALGHDWKVLRTVLTEYDEDGNQTQAGYTIYECTRCGEQYKDADSTGPPTPSTGTNDGGLIEFLNSLIKSLSDNLSGVVALLQRCFSEIPKLFSGFTAFLAAVFPFLPEEIMMLLTFGIAAVVIIGVIKAIRR